VRADYFRNLKLDYNDTITYRKGEAGAQNPTAPEQPEGERPYTGMIADFTDSRIGVRADGLHGKEPLYYVWPEDVIAVRKRHEITR
jgi:hypothetical protein